jgi:hypothetical protein
MWWRYCFHESCTELPVHKRLKVNCLLYYTYIGQIYVQIIRPLFKQTLSSYTSKFFGSTLNIVYFSLALKRWDLTKCLAPSINSISDQRINRFLGKLNLRKQTCILGWKHICYHSRIPTSDERKPFYCRNPQYFVMIKQTVKIVRLRLQIKVQSLQLSRSETCI